MESKYKVIYTGEILEGFSLDEVEKSFAKLFGIQVGQVSSYLKPNKVIKKGLNQDRANVYKNKLEKIGLILTLEEEHTSFAAMELELEANLAQAQNEREQQETIVQKPAPEPIPVSAPNPEPVQSSNKPTSFNMDSLSVVGLENSQESQASIEQENVNSGLFSCPKCGTQQIKSEQCTNSSCGVFFHKFEQTQKQEEQYQEGGEVKITEDDSEEITLVDKLTPIIGGFIAAAIAIYIWIYTSIEFEINSMLPVLIVGGVIGFVISVLNKHQRDLRVVAAVVTFSSLLIGSVIAIGVLKDKGVELLKVEMAKVEEVPSQIKREVYSEYIKQFKSLHSEMQSKAAILGQLHNFADSLAGTKAGVGKRESAMLKRFFNDYFYTYTHKHYMKIYNILENEDPNMSEISEIMDNSVYEYIEGYSNFEFFKAIMSKLDWLFYFLAAAAAFQIARPKY